MSQNKKIWGYLSDTPAQKFGNIRYSCHNFIQKVKSDYRAMIK